MKRASPTLFGFRVMMRRPSIGLAEITWRWTFGLAVMFLLAGAVVEFLDTLPVSNADLFLLKTRQPFLVSQAISHILRGTTTRVVLTALVVSVAMSLAWIVVASLGRAVTLNNLVSQIRSDFQFEQNAESPRSRFRTLIGLNLLRVVVVFTSVVGTLGAFVIAGMVSPDHDPSPGSAFAILMLLMLLIATAGVLLNWFLSLAAVFACTSHADTFSALAAAVELCRERLGSVLAASAAFGFAHLVAFFVASSAVGVPLGFAGLLPVAVMVGGVLLVTLLYLAVADFLYIGRLAAYIGIVEIPELPEPVPLQPPPPQAPQRIDQDELILSDIPMLPASLPS